jgi:hypothetical protein
MATRKTTSNETPVDEPVLAYQTSTVDERPAEPEPAADADADEPEPAADADADADEPETDEQREAREARDADQVASVQSGFATAEPLPVAEVAPSSVPALNAATLDGIPAPVDRATEMITDPESGAIVSVPVDRDKNTDGDDSE